MAVLQPTLENYLAKDYDTVRTRSGHVIARFGMVNYEGDTILSSYVYVNPNNFVDYITKATRGYNDLAYISHRHTYEDVRDTSLYYPLRARVGMRREGEYPGLKRLYKEVFGEEIQVTEDDPVEDARASMRLFMHVREDFEAALAKNEGCVAGIPRSDEKWFW